MVEPVHPFERGELDGFEGPPSREGMFMEPHAVHTNTSVLGRRGVDAGGWPSRL